MVMIAVPGLNEDGRVTETVSKELVSNHINVYSFSNMFPCIFNRRVSVNIGKESQTESFIIVGRICESIDNNTCCSFRSLKLFSNPCVQLVIHDTAPHLRLLIMDWDCISRDDLIVCLLSLWGIEMQAIQVSF